MMEAIRKFFARIKAWFKSFLTNVETKYEAAKDELEEKIKHDKEEEAADKKLDRAEVKQEVAEKTSGVDSVEAINAAAEVDEAKIEHAAAKKAKTRSRKKK
jgi:hypothetical protein